MPEPIEPIIIDLFVNDFSPPEEIAQEEARIKKLPDSEAKTQALAKLASFRDRYRQIFSGKTIEIKLPPTK